MIARVLPLLLAAGIFATGCAAPKSHLAPASESRGLVRGSVSYREPVVLPANAVVDVWLNDETPEETPLAKTRPSLAETTFAVAGRQVPLLFEMTYDPLKIESGHAYALRASIRSAGRMLFTTPIGIPVKVLGKPAEPVLWLTQVPDSSATDATGLRGTIWRLAELGGAAVVPDAEATLEFPETGKVVGQGTCNRFFGTVTITGQTITFGPLGTTRMACSEAAGAQEAIYLKALEGADRYEIDGSVLLIQTHGLDKPLRFVRREP